MIIGGPVPDQLNVDEAAALLGTTAATVRKWNRSLSFPLRRDTLGQYVNTSELREWVRVWGHNSAGVALR